MPYDPDQQFRGQPLFGMYDGFITHREDPDKLGRVKVYVPGVIESSDWIFPVGGPGGGGPQRGMWFIPPEGAAVAVFFVAGDIEQPRYMPAHWGTGEPPTDSHHDVMVIETKHSIIDIDDRSGSRKIRIRLKETDNKIELNTETGIVTVQGESKVIVASDEVLLGGSGADEPVPLGNVLNDFLTGILDLMQSMSPLGNLGAPVPFSSDLIGSNEYGAGGVIAVTTAMKLAIDQHLSQKTKTE